MKRGGGIGNRDTTTILLAKLSTSPTGSALTTEFSEASGSS